MDTTMHLELKNVNHRYDAKSVLSIDLLQIEKGKIYSLVGPNGCGKTTLLHIMGMILEPTGGELFFEGKKIERSGAQLIAARRRVTVVPQSPYMFDTTVRANMEYGLKARGIAKKEREKRVDQIVDLLKLTDFAKRRARDLSGGETQLIALARGIILEPAILLLDEITANLDAKHVDAIETIIRDINRRRGTTIIMTTHKLSQAYSLADQVFSLFNGRLVESGVYNLFRGTFKTDNQEPLFDTGKINIHLAHRYEDNKSGHISINPEDIIVSKEQLHSSARNLFSGTIVKIIRQGEAVHLEVDAQECFRVQITPSSFHEMGLTLGTRVFLIFKASSVHVL